MYSTPFTVTVPRDLDFFFELELVEDSSRFFHCAAASAASAAFCEAVDTFEAVAFSTRPYDSVTRLSSMTNPLVIEEIM